MLEDELVFGPDALIYCASHMRVHGTGWCTVAVADKTLLEATEYPEAAEECRRRSLELWYERKRSST